jgi:DNA-binding response OmpR family regulator
MSGTILFVDDEPEVRDTAANYFQHFGFKLLAAENPKEALNLAVRFPIDVVVLDVNLADLAGQDGSNLMSSLKLKLPGTPVILYTGLDEDDLEVKEMLKQGAEKVVSKAASLNELLKVIQAIVKS